jgi:hypothetical protein
LTNHDELHNEAIAKLTVFHKIWKLAMSKALGNGQTGRLDVAQKSLRAQESNTFVKLVYEIGF